MPVATPTTASPRWSGRAGALVVAMLAALFATVPVGPGVAQAGAVWGGDATGSAWVSAQVVPTGPTPVATNAGNDVTVTWEETLLSGGTPAGHYRVQRYDSGGVAQPVQAGCDVLVTGLSCTESGVPDGTWKYTVTPRRVGWTGAESAPSSPVFVSPATLTFSSSTTLTSLPATLNGDISGFTDGDTLSFHLDDPLGPVLSGTPATVPVGGSSPITVTIPGGTNDDPHTIVAVDASGRLAGAPITIVDPPGLTSLEQFDADADGRIDEVVATFDEPLASYTAGVAPWTLANVPSGGILSSVTVSGSAAILHLAEGPGAHNTAVGSFTVALAANASGIRDGNGHRASFAATAPVDKAAPAPVTVELRDTTANGKVDRVVATFSETLAAYTAGNAPWTLTNVPSGGTLASVAASGAVATLTLTEGAGAVNTAVGSMTVALASSGTGVRDAADNRTTFGARTPLDRATPLRTALEMFDVDGNGRVDRVTATFSEPLASYTAGSGPWTLVGTPSGGSLASVTVSGAVATLALTEGTGAPSTAVGAFRVTLAADAAGIRDADANLAAFTSATPTDRAQPVLTLLELRDNNTNGKVDRVTATFSETLGTYTAATAPWTLAGVPSGGTLSAVARAGAVLTLTITEGAGAADTAVGSMTVALAASATGAIDATGNQGSFTARAPLDKAGPVALAVTDTNGTTNGRAEAGDTVILDFTEALASGIPSNPTVTLTDPNTTGSDTITISGVTNGARSTGSNNYVSTNNVSVVFNATTTTSNGGRRLTVTLGACTTNCGSVNTNTANATFSYAPPATLFDAAANAAIATRAVSTSMRLF